MESKLHYGGTGEEIFSLIDSIAVDISDDAINHIKPLGDDNYVIQHFKWALKQKTMPQYGFSIYIPQPKTETLNQEKSLSTSSGLRGYILLQVESHGEAWYVQPDTGKRFYMKDGVAAYEMMRSFGLGVSEIDYTKIADGNTALLNKLRGKIILRPQAHGEAYYVHPKDLSVHYLQNGEEAYRIMRLYSLGITNTNLEKIPMGDPLK